MPILYDYFLFDMLLIARPLSYLSRGFSLAQKDSQFPNQVFLFGRGFEFRNN